MLKFLGIAVVFVSLVAQLIFWGSLIYIAFWCAKNFGVI